MTLRSWLSASLILAMPLLAQNPPYLDPDLAPEKRAADLVSRMTLEEKVLQMQNNAPAIPRLGIPQYNWWSEALHGVARKGIATVFPQALALAATWDTDLVYRVADVISTEARAKYNEGLRTKSPRPDGLSFWSPNINIFRDPRWGRGQETYGEDPYLTSRIGVAFVKGMQGNDPKYFKVIATPKHYAVHSGPEPLRHSFDARVSERDLMETYLPAFRATVVEGKAYSVMCAYSAVNGVPACASADLLQKRLRGDWGFQGYVVSDCGAIADITTGHKYAPSMAEASAIAVKTGTDLTCGNEYRTLLEAVKNGSITETEINRAAERLFVARIKLGDFDPPERVPFNKITIAQNDTPEHRALALEAARKSIVLLKNRDGFLPLKPSVRRIAVIGPGADDAIGPLGNYNGTPSRLVTPVEGIRRQFQGKAQVDHALGSTYSAASPVPMPVTLTPTAEGGSISTGEVVAPYTGKYTIAVAGFAPAAVYLDDKEVISSAAQAGPVRRREGTVELVAGRSYKVRVESQPRPAVPGRGGMGGFGPPGAAPGPQLSWIPPAEPLLAEAVELVKNSDVAIALVGLTASLEGEEMRGLKIPGFEGGDRTALGLPEQQERLIQAAVETGKPVVVVLLSGSAIAANDAQERAAAVLEAWYGGEEIGTAIAETLAGVNNPAGRLPVTFYRSVDQLPPFTDYAMKGRTYRYFKGDPLYPFGFGLSYSTFRYTNLSARRQGEGAKVAVRVRNASKVAGDEVVQLYVNGAGGPDDPIRSLRGFQRIHLAAGETRQVEFTLGPEDLPKTKTRITVGGGQPAPGVPYLEATL
jgi:beta-glucosidase